MSFNYDDIIGSETAQRIGEGYGADAPTDTNFYLKQGGQTMMLPDPNNPSQKVPWTLTSQNGVPVLQYLDGGERYLTAVSKGADGQLMMGPIRSFTQQDYSSVGEFLRDPDNLRGIASVAAFAVAAPMVFGQAAAGSTAGAAVGSTAAGTEGAGALGATAPAVAGEGGATTLGLTAEGAGAAAPTALAESAAGTVGTGAATGAAGAEASGGLAGWWASLTPAQQASLTAAGIKAIPGVAAAIAGYSSSKDQAQAQAENAKLAQYQPWNVETPNGTTTFDPTTRTVRVTPGAAQQRLSDSAIQAATGFQKTVTDASGKTPDQLGQDAFDRYLAYARPKQQQALDATLASQIGNGALGNMGSGYGNAAIRGVSTGIADSDYKAYEQSISDALSHLSSLQTLAGNELGISQSVTRGADATQTGATIGAQQASAGSTQAQLANQSAQTTNNANQTAAGQIATAGSNVLNGVDLAKVLGGQQQSPGFPGGSPTPNVSVTERGATDLPAAQNATLASNSDDINGLFA